MGCISDFPWWKYAQTLGEIRRADELKISVPGAASGVTTILSCGTGLAGLRRQLERALIRLTPRDPAAPLT